ncbi:oxidoreductase [Rhodococcus sp. Eu-32]|uniref:zinc-binding dehydrogenase n=1 Tax=Rhodococcus sp. Eu-32 TaxID=1017319 RepID=UPI000DF2DC2E|nr:zinc-binding dehydrogenase [Rhodococcus sp. Eu-32]RRQ25654.1 oxidoreductase [Rhodococcus sp. Eu-32]
MKAAILSGFGDPAVLVARDVAEPRDEAGWVTVDLKAAALNWHDVLVRRGNYSSPLPHVPGADGSGIRRDNGQPVVILPSLFWGDSQDAPSGVFEILGDRVPGTYAECVSVPIECTAPVPMGWSMEQAAGLSLAGVTAFRALVSRAGLSAGESLLVVGAGGGISTFAVNLATGLGATAFVTGSSDAKIARACDGGAVAGVVHSGADWGERARALSPGGQGFDVVLDPVGLWDKSIRALRPGGRMVVLGANAADRTAMDVRSFFFGQYNLLGTTMGSPADFQGLLNAVAQGALRPPAVAATFPLEKAADAHRTMEAGAHFGKIVLTME